MTQEIKITTCLASFPSEAVTLRRRGQVNVVVIPVKLLLNLSPQTSSLVFLCILCPFLSFPFLSSPSLQSWKYVIFCVLSEENW